MDIPGRTQIRTGILITMRILILRKPLPVVHRSQAIWRPIPERWSDHKSFIKFDRQI